MGLIDDQRRPGIAAKLVREHPGGGLVAPHQRRFEHEAALHAEVERDLHGLDRIVPAVRIAGVVGLAHAADDALDAAAIGDGCGIGEEEQVAAGDEG